MTGPGPGPQLHSHSQRVDHTEVWRVLRSQVAHMLQEEAEQLLGEHRWGQLRANPRTNHRQTQTRMGPYGGDAGEGLSPEGAGLRAPGRVHCPVQ